MQFVQASDDEKQRFLLVLGYLGFNDLHVQMWSKETIVIKELFFKKESQSTDRD